MDGHAQRSSLTSVTPDLETMLRFALCLLIFGLSSAAESSPLHVLFVGNSYTYTHNLPEVFRRVAASHGRTISVKALTAPGVAIEDHFSSGALQRELAAHWDIVVIQQGPSSLPQNRRHLIHWTVEVARRIDPARTRLVLFGVWPAQVHEHTWVDAELSYALAASKAGGCLFPAAAAWRMAFAEHPELPLYSSDGLHPSREGALLAALTLGRALWGAPPKLGGIELERQFSESAWQPALRLAPLLAGYAWFAVTEARPSCRD